MWFIIKANNHLSIIDRQAYPDKLLQVLSKHCSFSELKNRPRGGNKSRRTHKNREITKTSILTSDSRQVPVTIKHKGPVK